jgi:hypothetical protein
VRRWLVSLLVLVALTGGALVRAQEDTDGHLSGEQRALIDRVVHGTDTQAITVILGTATRTVSQSVTFTQSVDLVQIDGEDNIRAEVSAVVMDWDESS